MTLTSKGFMIGASLIGFGGIAFWRICSNDFHSPPSLQPAKHAHSEVFALPVVAIDPKPELSKTPEFPEESAEVVNARRRALMEQIAGDPDLAANLKFRPVTSELAFSEEELMRFGLHHLKGELQSELDTFLAKLHQHDQSNLELVSEAAGVAVYYVPALPDTAQAWTEFTDGLTAKLGSSNLGKLMADQVKNNLLGISPIFEWKVERVVILRTVPDRAPADGPAWELNVGVISPSAGYSRDQMISDTTAEIIRAKLHSVHTQVISKMPRFLSYLTEDDK
jgi:hypothetical protein